MIGFKIKEIRDKKGYSQEYLAAQCNIKQCTYSRIETGKIKPDIYKLKIIAEVLAVDLGQLLI